jgi:hypothetical protein
MKQYIVETEVSLSAMFKDASGNLVDPTDVTGEIILPDQTVVALAPVRMSLGVYRALFTPTLNGLHQYKFQGTGVVVAAVEGRFTAQTSFSS